MTIAVRRRIRYNGRMKTVTFSQAQSKFPQLFDQALNGEPIIVQRGKRRVVLRACRSLAEEREWAEFCAAFSPGPPEPPDAQARIQKAIRRVRQRYP